MAAHTPDNFEKNLEEDKENDYSKIDSCGSQEKDSSNLVDHSPNLYNVFQIFQNPQVIEFLRELMSHQVPQNLQSSQSNHTVTSLVVISPQDENPPNPDRNESTVSHVDDSSAETECLENLTQEKN